MEVQEFGKQNSRKIMLLPGNMMSWRQFEAVIPLLEKQYHVIDTFAPDPEAKVAIWYGSNEPNMKKSDAEIKTRLPQRAGPPLCRVRPRRHHWPPGCDGKGHHRLYEKLTLGEVSGTAHCNPLTR